MSCHHTPPARTFLASAGPLRASWGRACRLWGLGAASLAIVSCARVHRDTTPDGTIEAYAQALREGDAEAAHSLLSRPKREQLSGKRFSAQVHSYDRETQEIAEALSSPILSVRKEARVTLVNGTELTLVEEPAGHWRIASPGAVYYDQSSPRAALQAFVRALRHERWQALLELMPDAARGDLTAEALGASLKQQRQPLERMLALLETSLDAPIERTASRATMPYGDRFAVRFVKEGDLWKIEDPE